MDPGDVEQIATTYLRNLATNYELRLAHSKLKDSAALVNLINVAVHEKTAPLSTSDYQHFQNFLETRPNRDALHYQETIKGMTHEYSCGVGTGVNPTHRYQSNVEE